MNRAELITALSEKVGTSKKVSDEFVSALIETVTEELAKGEKVSLVGFGTFSVSEVAERTGIIQMGERKGETYTTPAHKKPSFKAGAPLKDAVNK
ncbi:HU family DNA-binding protein [Lachnospiraceae bacterium 54-53]